MTKETEYNGWPNRATWNVMLWLDNEESAYRYYVERVRVLKAKGLHITGARARAIAINALGERTPDGVKLGTTNVHWSRIAEAMLESAE